MNRTVILKFLDVPNWQKIVGNICISEQTFYSRWVPLFDALETGMFVMTVRDLVINLSHSQVV